MRRTAFAEWLLRRFTDEARATSIVGDLAEAAGEKGGAWFWWSYAGVLASATWRPFGGFALAAVVAWFGGRYYKGGGCYTALLNVNAPKSLPAALLMYVVDYSGDFSAFIFLFAAVRFGLNDRLTRLALGFAVLGGVVNWFFFVDHMVAIAAAAIAALCVYGFTSSTGRRSLIVLPGLWIAFAALDFVVLKIFRVGMDHVLGLTNTAFVYQMWFCLCYFTGLAIACLLCARVHRAVIANDQLVRA